MSNKFKLGVIGAGFMSKAIINGAITSKAVKPEDVLVSDISIDSLKILQDNGVNITTNNLEVFDKCEYVLFAIKPQTFYSLKEDFSSISNKKIISIMAGVKKQAIKSAIKNSLVVRCMPNTPCSISSGAIGVDVSDFTDNKDVEFVNTLFSSIAEVVYLDEKQLNTVTAISGSSPAYFYLFAKHLIDEGVKNGLSLEDAKKLVVNTMIGSGKMILNNDKSLDELINAVCSKGGTTIQAINVFNDSDFSEIISTAVTACKNRAQEIEEG